MVLLLLRAKCKDRSPGDIRSDARRSGSLRMHACQSSSFHARRPTPCKTVGDDGSVVTDRDRLRATFDSAARFYQQARPDYPEELYDELVRLADLRCGDRLLEIGCAAGKATDPLARSRQQRREIELRS